MDEEGETELRKRAEAAARGREQSSMTLRNTTATLEVLEHAMAQLRLATGVQDTEAMIDQFFTHRSLNVTLKADRERTEKTLQARTQELEDVKAEEQAVKVLTGPFLFMAARFHHSRFPHVQLKGAILCAMQGDKLITHMRRQSLIDRMSSGHCSYDSRWDPRRSWLRSLCCPLAVAMPWLASYDGWWWSRLAASHSDRCAWI